MKYKDNLNHIYNHTQWPTYRPHRMYNSLTPPPATLGLHQPLTIGAEWITNLGTGGDRSDWITSWSWIGIFQITTIGSAPDNAIIRHLETEILHANRVVSVRSLR